MGRLAHMQTLTSTVTCTSFHLQNECLRKTFPMKITSMTVQVTYIFIPIVSLKDLFCHRDKSKLGIGLFIHELLREPLIFFCSQTCCLAVSDPVFLINFAFSSDVVHIYSLVTTEL